MSASGMIDDYHKLEADRDRWRGYAERLLEYATHESTCVLTTWCAGEPTPDGGYRSKYGDKWYQTKPIDETPKCECGLDALISEVKKALEESK
jgi:hypothetical protein